MSSPTAQGGVGAEVVHLDVPATSGRLRLIRLAVVGLATEYGADVDDLEDVRIATGEICTHLVNRAQPGARLAVEIRVTPDGGEPDAGHRSVTVDVRASVDGMDDPGPLDDLSDIVLATTASEHGVDAAGGSSASWFRRELSAVAGELSGGEGGQPHDV